LLVDKNPATPTQPRTSAQRSCPQDAAPAQRLRAEQTRTAAVGSPRRLPGVGTSQPVSGFG